MPPKWTMSPPAPPRRLPVGRLVRPLPPGTLFPQELLVLQHLPLARLRLRPSELACPQPEGFVRSFVHGLTLSEDYAFETFLVAKVLCWCC